MVASILEHHLAGDSHLPDAAPGPFEALTAGPSQSLLLAKYLQALIQDLPCTHRGLGRRRGANFAAFLDAAAAAAPLDPPSPSTSSGLHDGHTTGINVEHHNGSDGRLSTSFIDKNSPEAKRAAAERLDEIKQQQAMSNQDPRYMTIPPEMEAIQKQAEEARAKTCDVAGRIVTAPSDGANCTGKQACVSALPADFCQRLGDNAPKWCSQKVTPECPEPPPCVQPQCKAGEKCPKVKCPPPPPCPEPYILDVARANAGQPWCVSPKELKAYGGPIEVRCEASGPGARKEGAPTGCWLLKQTSQDYSLTKDRSRISGPIKIPGLNAYDQSKVDPSVYVQDDPQNRGLSEAVAENFVINGSLEEPSVERLNSYTFFLTL